ncbi:MAG: hypothetical protein NZ700_09710 [Gemmataceae bacterium]|nr:hypothetical protein [Gemmataceae bacterium]MDW8266897.1 hypothetical protein [Gemmataceae bacterium]
MSPYEYVLAVALLTSPPETPEPPVSPEMFPALQAAVQELATQWEILDPRERRYILVRPEDFSADLNLLRRRYQELADAPPLADSLRFPDRDTVSDFLAFNRSYRHYIEVRQPVELSRWSEFRSVIQETDHLYQIWDTVRDARCEYYYVTVRRQALKKLRDLLGEDDYYRGHLPPYVPIWRFREID